MPQFDDRESHKMLEQMNNANKTEDPLENDKWAKKMSEYRQIMK